MSKPIVEIHDLDFSYNGQPVLRDINLEIKAGDFMAMIGPNGGGKTTLLKILLGLHTPDRGNIHVLGQPPRRVSHRIGYVPQNIHINQRFPISALDVVLMGLLNPGNRWARRSRQERLAAYRALEAMQMRAYGERRIGELSGGQRQRVFIARALVTNPEILLLDEPTASIDATGQHAFYEMLNELSREMTIVLASHDLMALSRYVKSVACINRTLHYHDQGEITEEMIASMYRCSLDENCPVELIAHGIPHRVLKEH
jgi:zinc transport system ATP-binding protein